VRRLLLGLRRKAFIVDRVENARPAAELPQRQSLQEQEREVEALGARQQEGDAIVALPFSWA